MRPTKKRAKFERKHNLFVLQLKPSFLRKEREYFNELLKEFKRKFDEEKQKQTYSATKE